METRCEFKSAVIKGEFLSYLPIELSTLVEWLSVIRMNKLDGKSITVTGVGRAVNLEKPSYHAVWRAVDIRTKDMAPEVRTNVLVYARSLARAFNCALPDGRRLQVESHDELVGKEDEHIHIELDGGRAFLLAALNDRQKGVTHA